MILKLLKIQFSITLVSNFFSKVESLKTTAIFLNYIFPKTSNYNFYKKLLYLLKYCSYKKF